MFSMRSRNPDLVGVIERRIDEFALGEICENGAKSETARTPQPPSDAVRFLCFSGPRFRLLHLFLRGGDSRIGRSLVCFFNLAAVRRRDVVQPP
jgi:hypothetical protein